MLVVAAGPQFLVLDEADRLFEKGHFDALDALLKSLAPTVGGGGAGGGGGPAHENAAPSDEELEEADGPAAPLTTIAGIDVGTGERPRKAKKAKVGKGGGDGGGGAKGRGGAGGVKRQTFLFSATLTVDGASPLFMCVRCCCCCVWAWAPLYSGVSSVVCACCVIHVCCVVCVSLFLAIAAATNDVHAQAARSRSRAWRTAPASSAGGSSSTWRGRRRRVPPRRRRARLLAAGPRRRAAPWGCPLALCCARSCAPTGRRTPRSTTSCCGARRVCVHVRV